MRGYSRPLRPVATEHDRPTNEPIRRPNKSDYRTRMNSEHVRLHPTTERVRPTTEHDRHIPRPYRTREVPWFQISIAMSLWWTRCALCRRKEKLSDFCCHNQHTYSLFSSRCRIIPTGPNTTRWWSGSCHSNLSLESWRHWRCTRQAPNSGKHRENLVRKDQGVRDKRVGRQRFFGVRPGSFERTGHGNCSGG